MLTRDEIDEWPESHALAVWEALGEMNYGSRRFGAQFAFETGITNQTVANWRKNRPPTWAILFLDRTLAYNEMRRRTEAFNSALTALAEPFDPIVSHVDDA